MRTHKLELEITTATDIPLDLNMIKDIIELARGDSVVSVKVLK